MSWARMPPLEIEAEGAVISIETTMRATGDAARVATLRQDAVVTVTAPGPLDERSWQEAWVKPLQDLLTFATGTPSRLDYMGLRAPAKGSREVESMRRRPKADLGDERALTPYEMLFTLGDAGDRVGTVLGRWLSFCREQRDIVNLLLSTRYADSMYEENRLQNLVQALEALHRREHGEDKPLPRADEEKIARVVAAAPEANRSWLERQLANLRRISLADRVRGLLDEHPWFVGDVVPRRAAFVRDVVDARNLHTHWDRSHRTSTPAGHALWPLYQALVVLLEAAFLVRLGFSTEEARDLVRRGSRAYEALRLNRVSPDVPGA